LSVVGSLVLGDTAPADTFAANPTFEAEEREQGLVRFSRRFVIPDVARTGQNIFNQLLYV
jgi:hypothetical protein